MKIPILEIRVKRLCKKIQWLSISGSRKVANVLINYNADIHLKDVNDKTPLCVSIEFDQVAIAEILIENGANVNAKDENDWTPLHFAALKSN